MPVAIPTVTAADVDVSAGKLTSIQTAVDTICGYIDTANTAAAAKATKASLLAWINAVEAILVEAAARGESRTTLTSAYSTLVTALS